MAYQPDPIRRTSGRFSFLELPRRVVSAYPDGYRVFQIESNGKIIGECIEVHPQLSRGFFAILPSGVTTEFSLPSRKQAAERLEEAQR